MTLPAELVERVRRRADFACEYCGVTETDTGGLLTLADGTLHPIRPAGAFTLKRLRLNRPALVAYRFRKQVLDDEERLLARLHELFALLERLQEQQAALLKEQSTLLAEKSRLLQLLLKSRE